MKFNFSPMKIACKLTSAVICLLMSMNSFAMGNTNRNFPQEALQRIADIKYTKSAFGRAVDKAFKNMDVAFRKPTPEKLNAIKVDEIITELDTIKNWIELGEPGINRVAVIQDKLKAVKVFQNCYASLTPEERNTQGMTLVKALAAAKQDAKPALDEMRKLWEEMFVHLQEVIIRVEKEYYSEAKLAEAIKVKDGAEANYKKFMDAQMEANTKFDFVRAEEVTGTPVSDDTSKVLIYVDKKALNKTEDPNKVPDEIIEQHKAVTAYRKIALINLCYKNRVLGDILFIMERLKFDDKHYKGFMQAQHATRAKKSATQAAVKVAYLQFIDKMASR